MVYKNKCGIKLTLSFVFVVKTIHMNPECGF